MKQTAVEWLEQEFIALQNYGINEFGLFEIAKKMEKEQLNIKPLNYVYVAMHVEFAKPIVTSNTMESMFEAIDDYMGPNSKRLTWYPYDCKYPDSYQGHVEYRDEDDEIQTIKIYDVDFFNK